MTIPKEAGVNNLLGIYKVMTGRARGGGRARLRRCARGYGDLKRHVAEVVIEGAADLSRKRYYDLIDDVAELDRLLAVGA